LALGRRRSAKTDRLDARWLARLLAKEMLPASWIPPAQIQQLRDRTRLRKHSPRTVGAGVSLHAYLSHEGWPCSRSQLLRPPGLRWAAALRLSADARLQVDSLLAVMAAPLLAVMAALEAQLDTLDGGAIERRPRRALYDEMTTLQTGAVGTGRRPDASCLARTARGSPAVGLPRASHG
jgi:hypothetical protein